MLNVNLIKKAKSFNYQYTEKKGIDKHQIYSIIPELFTAAILTLPYLSFQDNLKHFIHYSLPG